MSEVETTTGTVPAKKAVKKVAGAKPEAAKPAAKKAAAKVPAVKEAAADKTPKKSKWLDPVLTLLAANPDGLTRAQIWEALDTKDLGGVLVKNTDLFKASKTEGVAAQTFSLTPAGKKAAAKVG